MEKTSHAETRTLGALQGTGQQPIPLLTSPSIGFDVGNRASTSSDQCDRGHLGQQMASQWDFQNDPAVSLCSLTWVEDKTGLLGNRQR